MTTTETVKLVIEFDSRGQPVVKRAAESLQALAQSINAYGAAARQNSRVLGQLQNDLNRTAAVWGNRFNSAVQLSQNLLTGFTRTLDRLGRYGFYTFLAGVGTATFALGKLAQQFLKVNEEFAGFEITLRSSFRSAGIARQLRDEVAKITAESPLPFTNLATAVRSLSVIPYSRGQLARQATAGNYSDPQGFLRQATRLLEQMVAFRPDKTVEDAIFALREALGGEFRSLIRRFDIPGSYISAVAGRSLKSLRGDDAATFSTLKKMFDQIITPSAVVEYTRQPRVFFQNLMEQIVSLPSLATGNSGFYQKVLKTTDQVFRVVSDFTTRNLEKMGAVLSASLSGAFDRLMATGQKAIESLLNLAGFGQTSRPGQDVMARGLAAFEAFVAKTAQILPDFIDSTLDFFRTITPALKQLLDVLQRVVSFFYKSFLENPVATTAVAASIPALYGAAPALAGRFLGWAGNQVTGRALAGFGQGALSVPGAGFQTANARTGVVSAGQIPGRLDLFGYRQGASFSTGQMLSALNPANLAANRQQANLLPFFAQTTGVPFAGPNYYRFTPDVARNVRSLQLGARGSGGWIREKDLLSATGMTTAQFQQLVRPGTLGRVASTGSFQLTKAFTGANTAVNTAAAESAILAGQGAGAISGLAGGLRALVMGIGKFVGIIAVLAAAVQVFSIFAARWEKERELRVAGAKESAEVFARGSLSAFNDVQESASFSAQLADAMQSRGGLGSLNYQGLIRGTRARSRLRRSGIQPDTASERLATDQWENYLEPAVLQGTVSVSGRVASSRLRQMLSTQGRLRALLSGETVAPFESSFFPQLDTTLFPNAQIEQTFAPGSAQHEKVTSALSEMYDQVTTAVQSLSTAIREGIGDLRKDLATEFTASTAAALADVQGFFARAGSLDILQQYFPSMERPRQLVEGIPTEEGISGVRDLDEWQKSMSDLMNPFDTVAKTLKELGAAFRLIREASREVETWNAEDPAELRRGIESYLTELTRQRAALTDEVAFQAGDRTFDTPFGKMNVSAFRKELDSRIRAVGNYQSGGTDLMGQIPPFFAEVQGSSRALLQSKSASHFGSTVDLIAQVVQTQLLPLADALGKGRAFDTQLDQFESFFKNLEVVDPETLRAITTQFQAFRDISRSGLTGEAAELQQADVAQAVSGLITGILEQYQPGGRLFNRLLELSGAEIGDLQQEGSSYRQSIGRLGFIANQARGIADQRQEIYQTRKGARPFTDEQQQMLAELAGDFQGLPSAIGARPTAATRLRSAKMLSSLDLLGERAGFSVSAETRSGLGLLTSDTSHPWQLANLLEKNNALQKALTDVAVTAASKIPQANEEIARSLTDIALAARTASEELAEMQHNLVGDGAWSSFKEGLFGITELWRSTMLNFRELGASMVQGLSGEFLGLFDAITFGSKKAGEAFRDFATSTLRMISNLLMQKVIQSVLGAGFGALGGFTGRTATPITQAYAGGPGLFASGGLISGGSRIKDDVLIAATGGEYVMQKSAVDRYGLAYMTALNNGSLPKFAGGGSVSAGTVVSSGGAVNITVNIPATGGVPDPQNLARVIQTAVQQELHSQRRNRL